MIRFDETKQNTASFHFILPTRNGNTKLTRNCLIGILLIRG